MLLKTETDMYKGAAGKCKETCSVTDLRNHRSENRQLPHRPPPILAKRTLEAGEP